MLLRGRVTLLYHSPPDTAGCHCGASEERTKCDQLGVYFGSQPRQADSQSRKINTGLDTISCGIYQDMLIKSLCAHGMCWLSSSNGA
ncbi:hypothetical protein RRG08_062549 [Elysia crispata]|uniref:Uncharacterized protein n=1 Tax=Elysia crispata TaxID=231223 RepID=A0AAE1ACA3_9GAST|nr:hypothetical protein RRG08_062549 [Elysia crispata]